MRTTLGLKDFSLNCLLRVSGAIKSYSKVTNKPSCFAIPLCYSSQFILVLQHSCAPPCSCCYHFLSSCILDDAGIMQSPCCRAEEDPMNIVAPLLHRVFQCASKQPSFRITDCLCSSMPLQFSLCIFSMKTNRSESVQI